MAKFINSAGQILQLTGGGGGGGLTAGMSTQGNTAGTTGLVASQLLIVGSNNITLSQSVNGQSATLSIIGGAGGGGSVNFSAGTTSNNLASVVFSNSNGVSFGLNGSTITGSVATSLTNVNVSAGTTSNNLSAFVLSNSNNVSFGLNGSTITATATVASTQGSIVVSAGTTSNTGSQFVWSNSNNVSFGLNGSTVTATVTVASTQGSIVISAGTTSNTGSQFVFSNSNNISFGLNGSTVTASVTQDKISHFMFPPGMAFLTNFTISNASMSLQHVNLPQQIIASRMNMLISLSGNSGSSGALTLSLGVYTMAGSTLSLASSDSRNLTWTSGSDTSASSRYGGVSGARYRTVSLNNWSLTPGDYMIGIWLRTTNDGTWRAYGRQGPTIVGAVDANETQHYHDGISGASFTTAMPASWNVTNTDWVRTGGDALKQAGLVIMGSF